MSFSLVGTATGARNATTSTITPTMPSYAAGDLAIFYAFARSTSETITTAPSGYTLLQTGVTTQGLGANANVFGKICGASETAPSVAFSSTSSHLAAMCVLRSSTGWPAIGTASDIVVNTTESFGNITGFRANEITPAEDNCCVLATCAKAHLYDNITAFSTPSGYTDAIEYNWSSISTGAALLAWFLEQTTATAIADQNGTITRVGDDLTQYNTYQLTLALRGATSSTVAPKASFYRMLRNA